jgi:hypothetical protein
MLRAQTSVVMEWNNMAVGAAANSTEGQTRKSVINTQPSYTSYLLYLESTEADIGE